MQQFKGIFLYNQHHDFITCVRQAAHGVIPESQAVSEQTNPYLVLTK